MKTGMLCILATGLFGMGCNAVKQSATHDLLDGFYTMKSQDGDKEKVYSDIEDSSITIYPFLASAGKQPDTAHPAVFYRYTPGAAGVQTPLKLVKHSVDIDVTTILLKYRFSTSTLPNQLNANLNAAVYAGYRTDFFTFHDTQDPLHRSTRNVSHFEFDLGVFAGIGITPINSSVTGGQLDVEYDGVVFQKGVAFFMGSRQLTLGIGLGFDGLLDKNKSAWIYQEKPWLGLLIGLNLSN